MATAIETRDVLSKLEGVIRVHPDGLNGKALVFVKDKKENILSDPSAISYAIPVRYLRDLLGSAPAAAP